MFAGHLNDEIRCIQGRDHICLGSRTGFYAHDLRVHDIKCSGSIWVLQCFIHTAFGADQIVCIYLK